MMENFKFIVSYLRLRVNTSFAKRFKHLLGYGDDWKRIDAEDYFAYRRGEYSLGLLESWEGCKPSAIHKGKIQVAILGIIVLLCFIFGWE